MSKEQVSMDIAEDLQEHDLLNVADFNGDICEVISEASKIIKHRLEDYTLVKGEIF